MCCSFRMRFVIVASCLLAIAAASFCGQSAVPFTFQVLRAGYPVLGCARPRCFGWTIDGHRANDTAQFYRVNGKEDGYMRRSDELSAPAQPVVTNQIAECDGSYRTSSCESGEWLGGLAPVTDIGSKTVLKRCCRYEGLFETEDRGIATVHNGQLVVGGEVTQHGRVVAFDYISDMVKEVADNGTVSYSVSIRRMPCFDEPTHDLVDDNAIVGGTQPEDQTVNTIEGVNIRRRVSGVPLSPQQPLPLQPLPHTPQPQPAPTAAPVPQTISQYAVQQTGQPSQQGQEGGQPGYNTQQQQQQPINNGYQNYYQQQQTTVDPMTALFGSNPLAELFKNPPAMQLPNLFAPPQQQSQQLFGGQEQTQQYAQQQQASQQAAAPGFYQQQTQLYNTQQQQQTAYPQSQQNTVTIQPQPQQGYGNGVEQMMQQQSQQQPTGQYQQVQQQYQPQQQAQYTQTPQQQQPVLPTLPPLGELPKLPDIPSPEEVEQNMPPVQRAILTSVANFFGVL